MALGLFLLSLTIFWLAVHSIPALLHHLRASRSTLLPAPLLSHTHHASSFTSAPTSLYRSDTTTITLSPFHLRLSTSALNPAYDRLAEWLARSPRLKRALVLVYDAGTIVGIVGMLVSVACVAWTCFQLGGLLFVASASAEASAGLAKRRWDDAPVGDIPRHDSGVQIQILIPGVTLPLSHLPPLFLALVFSQAFHEAGHVLCAALDQIPLQALGASFALLFPSLFTALPASSSARLPAAGPLHNLLLFLLLLVPLAIPKTDGALTVTAVEPDSALVDFVRRGDVVVALDDMRFENTGPRSGAWKEYLLRGDATEHAELGWCVDTAWFLAQSAGCCTANMTESTDACFTYATRSEPHPTAERCIDPLPLLAPPNRASVPARCSVASAEDRDGARGHSHPSCACVRPRADQQLLRLVLASGEHGMERVILWRGPRWEVYEQITVSSTRLPWLPFWISDAFSLFFTYARTLSLTLFVLNLLPLAPLDGAHLLDALLIAPSGTRDAELDDVESGKTRRLRRTWAPRLRDGRRVGTAVKRVTQGLVGLCVVLGALAVLRDGLW